MNVALLMQHCCWPQEAELFEAVFYGLTKRVQTLVMQNVSLNCTDKVC